METYGCLGLQQGSAGWPTCHPGGFYPYRACREPDTAPAIFLHRFWKMLQSTGGGSLPRRTNLKLQVPASKSPEAWTALLRGGVNPETRNLKPRACAVRAP